MQLTGFLINIFFAHYGISHKKSDGYTKMSLKHTLFGKKTNTVCASKK